MDTWIVTGATHHGEMVWCEVPAPDRNTALKYARWTYPQVRWQQAWFTLTRGEAAQKHGSEYTTVINARKD